VAAKLVSKIERVRPSTSVHGYALLFFVLVLVLVLVLALALALALALEAVQYSNPAHWSASSREPLGSTIGIEAV
jgi:uncharacterized BrkB/YihY/UPF0761 family membrane protein